MAHEDAQSSSSTGLSLTNQLENVKVAVRLRPFTEKERQRNNRRIVDIEQNTVVLFNPSFGDVNLKKFTFDYSYWSHDGFRKDSAGINIPDPEHPNSSKYVGQEKVFEDLGHFLLTNALAGYNSALLAYGPTGSGKSYTVSGYGQNEGILPRFARALFEELDKKAKVLSRSSTETKNEDNVDQNVKETRTDDSVPDEKVETTTNEAPTTDASTTNQEEQKQMSSNRYEVYFSMIEIYNEVVRDLLATNHGDMVTQSTIARKGLKVREHPKHGFFVENLTSYACANKSEIERKIEGGQLNKSIAATSMNETSSRGHTIYEFKIKQYKLKSLESPEETLTTSVVQLVDLAGSERMAVHVTGQLGVESFIGSRSNSPYPMTGIERNLRTGSKRIPTSASSLSSTSQQSSSVQKRNNIQSIAPLKSSYQQRFKESVSINQSLSALGNCIQVLSHYSQQMESTAQIKRPPPKIPYRDSVLTKLLNRCCLSGNSKVVIIATLSPVDTSYDDTLSTLRFADRAKRIRTHATVNRLTRGDIVDNLQKENDRLKQIVDGRVTRSDDSSQTSNFDDTENVMENFTGSKISKKTTSVDVMATPSRSRTTVRKTRDVSKSKRRGVSTGSTSRITSSSSNPSLAVKEEMKRLVSPASRKLAELNGENGKTIQKSRSIGQGLTKAGSRMTESRDGDTLDVKDDIDAENLEEIDLSELGDIKEGLISTESEDSFSVLVDEDLTNEEKISIFNKLLSNSTNIPIKTPVESKTTPTTIKRPKKANGTRAGAKQMSMLSSSLKKTNPYLSNLNPDEQLTAVISYIIKKGETVIGKSSQCDIVLHGPELRARHAKIIRLSEKSEDGDSSDTLKRVFIEPILDKEAPRDTTRVALKVNGSTVIERTPLNHCDRLLFGMNAYFVFVDNINTGNINASDTLANLDLVTYDMAVNEVSKNVMSEAKNEATLKEINDYTHRPGTGKYRAKAGQETRGRDSNKPSSSRVARCENSKLMRSMTIQDHEEENARNVPNEEPAVKSKAIEEQEAPQPNPIEVQEANFRDQLMEDTYEYAMPVAEVNAVAKEMGIKVTYGLKILTGEEQIPDHINPHYIESTNNSDGFSSSSLGEGEDGRRNGQADSFVHDDRVTHLERLDYLDIPPALYIRVHFDEQGIDFYWSKEKFQARRFKILELYNPWDVGGKSGLVEHLIDQTKTQGNYVIDPFVDDPTRTFVLIGHAQITLQPLSHLTDLKQSYDILDLNDEIVGNISIQATPCHYEEANPDFVKLEPYKAISDADLANNILESPKELLGRRLIFNLKILSCHDIPEKFWNIFCQYTLNINNPSIRTKVVRDETLENEENHLGEDLTFNHSHYICFEKVNQDVLDFLERGFLTIQVLGQYRLSANISPTVISTIISSINKYKTKLDQQSANNDTNMNYSGSGYYNSNSNSTKSNRGPLSGAMNSNSGASSVVSTSATVNLFDQQNDDEEGSNSVNGASQENIIDMILTKRKLDRAENQLHYLKRTVNIAEHYNKKHIPVKTVKKLLNSYGHELDSGSIEEMAADVTFKARKSTGAPTRPKPTATTGLIQVRTRSDSSPNRIQYGIGKGKGGMKRMKAHIMKQMKSVIQKQKDENPPMRLKRLRTYEREHDIPLAPFVRLVKHILASFCEDSTPRRFQLEALYALRDVSESFMVRFFEDCCLFTAHAKRVTLLPRDVDLALRIGSKRNQRQN